MASVSRLYRCTGLQNPCWQHKWLKSHYYKVQHAKTLCTYMHSKLKLNLVKDPTLLQCFLKSCLVACREGRAAWWGNLRCRQKKRDRFKYKGFILLFDPTTGWDQLISAGPKPNDLTFCHPKTVFVEHTWLFPQHNTCHWNKRYRETLNLTFNYLC